MDLFRTKSVEQALHDTDEPEYQLSKRLTALDLTVFGVGVVVGAGIFTLTGRAAHQVAGPSIILSFVIAATCCALAAMCYAEFAAAVPVSGSAYTFSYSSLGEFLAWIIGWDLILELFLGAAVVSQGWSAYLGVFLDHIGIHIPHAIADGGRIDLMALLLVTALGLLVTVGIKESMRVNMVLVALKIFIVLFVIFAGLQFIDTANYHPFIPAAQAGAAANGLHQPLVQWALGLTPSKFGVGGIFAGAALVFFAYIGFDVVATAAEETKNPQRDLPIGIIASLIICTILYCSVALVVTGMVRYDKLDPKAALANAFVQHGKTWMSTLISAGAVAGLTTVVLTMMTGSTRLIFAMARDNLLPIGLARVHPRFRTPHLITMIVTAVCALTAALTPVGDLEQMVNIGTLTAFILVSVGIVVLRHKRPDLHRPFRGAVRTGAAHRVGPGLPVPVSEPRAAYLVAVPDLAGGGTGHLFPVLLQALTPGHGRSVEPPPGTGIARESLSAAVGVVAAAATDGVPLGEDTRPFCVDWTPVGGVARRAGQAPAIPPTSAHVRRGRLFHQRTHLYANTL